MSLTVERILQNYPFYSQASAPMQEKIAAAGNLVSAPAGHFLFGKGDVCRQVVLVGSGNIRIFSLADSGREISLYHVTQGGTCPINIMCALLGTTTPAMAVVDAPLEAVTLPAEQFRSWVESEAVVRQFTIEAMGKRLVDVITLVEELVFKRVDIRLADFLAARFKAAATEPPTIAMTHEEIAIEIGTAREVVSRTLRDFLSQGAVELKRGKITLRDISRLHAIMHAD